MAVWGSYPATLAGIPKTPLPPTDPPDPAVQMDNARFPDEFGPRPGWYALSVNNI